MYAHELGQRDAAAPAADRRSAAGHEPERRTRFLPPALARPRAARRLLRSMARRYERPAAPVAGDLPARRSAAAARGPAGGRCSTGSASSPTRGCKRLIEHRAGQQPRPARRRAQHRAGARAATASAAPTRCRPSGIGGSAARASRRSGGEHRQRLHRRRSRSPPTSSTSSAASRSLSDAALAQYLATEEARKAAQISLIAAVADHLPRRCSPTTSCSSVTRQTLRHARGVARASRKLRFDNGAVVRARLPPGGVAARGRARRAARVTRASARSTRTRWCCCVGQPLPADLPPALPLDAGAAAPTCRPACRRRC